MQSVLEDEFDYIVLVSSVLSALSLTERGLVCNGFGSQLPGLKIFTKAIPEYYRKLFTPAAAWHDVAYNLGGLEWHRDRADAHFLRLMQAAAASLPWRKRLHAWIWERASYRAVQVGGGLSWEYRDVPLSLAGLKAELKEKMRQ